MRIDGNIRKGYQRNYHTCLPFLNSAVGICYRMFLETRSTITLTHCDNFQVVLDIHIQLAVRNFQEEKKLLRCSIYRSNFFFSSFKLNLLLGKKKKKHENKKWENGSQNGFLSKLLLCMVENYVLIKITGYLF